MSGLIGDVVGGAADMLGGGSDGGLGGLSGFMQQENKNMIGLMEYGAQQSFEQSMIQTLGQLAESAAKAKPNV